MEQILGEAVDDNQITLRVHKNENLNVLMHYLAILCVLQTRIGCREVELHRDIRKSRPVKKELQPRRYKERIERRRKERLAR